MKKGTFKKEGFSNRRERMHSKAERCTKRHFKFLTIVYAFVQKDALVAIIIPIAAVAIIVALLTTLIVYFICRCKAKLGGGYSKVLSQFVLLSRCISV